MLCGSTAVRPPAGEGRGYHEVALLRFGAVKIGDVARILSCFLSAAQAVEGPDGEDEDEGEPYGVG